MINQFLKEKLNKQRGLTLIELLVSMSIFVIISGIISGLLISGINGQRHALASQRLLDQTSFAMEYMSRSLRMAKKAEDATCLAQEGSNYEITHGVNGIKFINSLENNDCQEFFWDDTDPDPDKRQLKQTIKMGTPDEAVLDLTSPSKLVVESFSIEFTGGPEIDLQPKISIAMRIRDNNLKIEDQPSIKIQTTLSQRNLDVQP